MDASNLSNNKITYPKCWHDDERMAALFSPFRVRDVNPENYDSKMKFWQDMIAQLCLQTGSVVFTKLTIQMAYKRDSHVPYGLDTVIDELIRLKKIRLRAEYENDPENGWTSWATNGLIWKPLAWSVLKLKNAFGYEDLKSENYHMQYVHLEAIDKYCKELQSKILEQHLGKLMHYKELKNYIKETKMEIKSDSLKLCLRKLNCQRSVILEYMKGPKGLEIYLIKIAEPNNKNSTKITETDRAIINLKLTQSNLVRQIEDLEQHIASAADKAREFVKENKRHLAKNQLRRKQLLEKRYEKRSVALQNIEELLNNITEAQSHGEIFDAYKIGSRALQNLLNNSGLCYESVDEVIADIRDTFDSQREIEDAMASVGTSDTNITLAERDELEHELEDLVEENSPKPKKPQLEFSEEELLAMLDQLEIEDKQLDQKKNQEETALLTKN